MKYREIRLILGDQLNEEHSWYQHVDEDVLYVMMEIKPESEYVTHHIQKIAGIFLCMRNFAEALKSKGHRVVYYKINDAENKQSFEKNIQALMSISGASKLSYQAPDEYRLDHLFQTAFSNLGVTVEQVSSEHFFTERLALAKMFKGKKSFLMETFYRKMRQEHEVLMEDGKPVTGKWNYDHENRKKLPAKHRPPNPIVFEHNVEDILSDIEDAGLNFIGSIEADKFIWPKNREEAIKVLTFFIEELLPNFGKFQDAMSDQYWSIYHSRISFAMNIKLINPKEVVGLAEEAWKQAPDIISIAQVEGFIRQILGWREYMRGIYWAHMPSYATLNYFNFDRKLPSWYWTGETKMNCLQKAIKQSLKYGYAHHIQRLMVTGNFSLLSGVHPDEIDQWYLGIYVDAFDWVEITNTRGMSQFGDGGIVGTKPYISSGSYINKMGDHCKGCHYNVKEKTGPTACPFNSLYWNFIDQHRNLLESNRRMSMMYRLWDKMASEQRVDLLEHASKCLENIEKL